MAGLQILRLLCDYLEVHVIRVIANCVATLYVTSKITLVSGYIVAVYKVNDYCCVWKEPFKVNVVYTVPRPKYLNENVTYMVRY